jgi:hypothetical protein
MYTTRFNIKNFAFYAQSIYTGAFEKLRKKTASYVMSVGPFLRPQGVTRLPLDGFWLNLIFEVVLRKSVGKIQVLL